MAQNYATVKVSDGLRWGVPIEQALKSYVQALRCKANTRENGQSVFFKTVFGENLIDLIGSIECTREESIILIIGLIPSKEQL